MEAGWRCSAQVVGDGGAARWALTIAARGGKRIAVVALARRLAGILYAMWRDNATYNAAKLRVPHPPVARAS